MDGHILAIGGFAFDDIFHFFDVVEARRVAGPGTWRDLAPMPTARSNFGIAELHGLVYTVGGYNELDPPLNIVETFNARSGRWATGLPLPQPRGGTAAAALGGLLYVAGGWDGSESEILNSVVVYNPETNT